MVFLLPLVVTTINHIALEYTMYLPLDNPTLLPIMRVRLRSRQYINFRDETRRPEWVGELWSTSMMRPESGYPHPLLVLAHSRL